ncbi:AraC family transcriptional regulator [Streptococcus tangpeifui]|uniref:AraC family transcriptional regulator n=1 Tax=Streptococcus tangpeifui TaxID=2709400 RepID=UPI0013EA436B|nr:AraC family transcriptional regulator [Streptococcus sp. ZJ373]
MNFEQDINSLEKHLFAYTENENYYLSNPNSLSKRYNNGSTPQRILNGKEIFEINDYKLRVSPLHIRKDSRFTPMPPHIYSNINLNFIYSGKCTYVINNKEVTLEAGDICFFDTQVIREKKKPNYDDIIINIVMKNSYLKSLLTVDTSNLLSTFISKTLYSNTSHNNYIIFKTKDSNKIRRLFQDLLLEHYSDRDYKHQAIQYYFSLIFLELLHIGEHQNQTEIHFSDALSNNIFNIVNYIENNYKEINLKKLAKLYGYHEKYLSSLLKNSYGKSFKEIQMTKRIAEVENYLVNSTYTISEIAEKAGFSNQNQLYQKFKDRYGMLPNEYRKLNQR